jgi:hypothetical protein
LRKDVGLGRAFARLGIDEHDLQPRLRGFRSQAFRQLEMHRQGDAMQNDGRADRYR